MDVACRDKEKSENPFAGPDEERYQGFRFNQEGFELGEYDQVWFFADNPGIESDDIDSTDPLLHKQVRFSPLESEEQKILATWMDEGGGVFAAGDHGLLGASLGSFIPRVRTMRRWTHDQNVPVKSGYNQNETLQPVLSGDPESDVVPQPIEPVLRHVVTSFSMFGSLSLQPHPIHWMCGW